MYFCPSFLHSAVPLLCNVWPPRDGYQGTISCSELVAMLSVEPVEQVAPLPWVVIISENAEMYQFLEGRSGRRVGETV
jgi:hypothetical protein